MYAFVEEGGVVRLLDDPADLLEVDPFLVKETREEALEAHTRATRYPGKDIPGVFRVSLLGWERTGKRFPIRYDLPLLDRDGVDLCGVEEARNLLRELLEGHEGNGPACLLDEAVLDMVMDNGACRTNNRYIYADALAARADRVPGFCRGVPGARVHRVWKYNGSKARKPPVKAGSHFAYICLDPLVVLERHIWSAASGAMDKQYGLLPGNLSYHGTPGMGRRLEGLERFCRKAGLLRVAGPAARDLMLADLCAPISRQAEGMFPDTVLGSCFHEVLGSIRLLARLPELLEGEVPAPWRRVAGQVLREAALRCRTRYRSVLEMVSGARERKTVYGGSRFLFKHGDVTYAMDTRYSDDTEEVGEIVVAAAAVLGGDLEKGRYEWKGKR